jgi:hypothetical protein
LRWSQWQSDFLSFGGMIDVRFPSSRAAPSSARPSRWQGAHWAESPDRQRNSRSSFCSPVEDAPFERGTFTFSAPSSPNAPTQTWAEKMNVPFDPCKLSVRTPVRMHVSHRFQPGFKDLDP